MKILFIIPPPKQQKKLFFSTQLPIGLGFLLSFVKSKGHDVSLIDYEVQEYSKSSFIKNCEEFGPHIIGFSCMTPQIESANYLAGLIAERLPHINTIIGGKHVTALPLKTMEHYPSFNFAIYGEGELSFCDLLGELGQNRPNFTKIKGLIWRDGSKITINPPRELINNLDSIPYPDRSMFDLEKYNRGMSFKGKWRDKYTTEILTSRGCPNECIFCSSQIVTQKKVRYRSIANIIQELEECKTKFNINHYKIVDDTFTLSKKRVREICNWFRVNKVTWSCNARVDSVDYELLKVMKDSGCIGIMYGVETGSPKMLKMVKKGITLDQIIRAFEWTHKAKIPFVEADFILAGHPDESIDDINLTKKLIKKIRPHFLAIGTVVPFPGTEVRKTMIERGFIEKWALEDWDNYVYKPGYRGWRYQNFTQEQLQNISRDIIHRFYLTPRFIWFNLKNLRSFGELLRSLKASIQFFKMFLKRPASNDKAL